MVSVIAFCFVKSDQDEIIDEDGKRIVAPPIRADDVLFSSEGDKAKSKPRSNTSNTTPLWLIFLIPSTHLHASTRTPHVAYAQVRKRNRFRHR